MTIDEIMRAAPVIPVLVIEQEMDWAALAETFVAAGLPVLEVTMRTPLALPPIAQMTGVNGAIVGAGTVVNEAQLGEAIDAGSKFIVSPGLTEPLGRAVIDSATPFCRESRPRPTSCAASISASTGSNSSPPKRRAAFPR